MPFSSCGPCPGAPHRDTLYWNRHSALPPQAVAPMLSTLLLWLLRWTLGAVLDAAALALSIDVWAGTLAIRNIRLRRNALAGLSVPFTLLSGAPAAAASPAVLGPRVAPSQAIWPPTVAHWPVAQTVRAPLPRFHPPQEPWRSWPSTFPGAPWHPSQSPLLCAAHTLLSHPLYRLVPRPDPMEPCRRAEQGPPPATVPRPVPPPARFWSSAGCRPSYTDSAFEWTTCP